MKKINEYGNKIIEEFLDKCKVDGTYQKVFVEYEDGLCLLEPSIKNTKDYAAWCLLNYEENALNVVDGWKEETPNNACWHSDEVLLTYDEVIAELVQSITETKLNGELIMSRIDAIKNYKNKCDEEKINKEKEEYIKREEYTEQILALRPRIAELISVANACLENGIEINKSHTYMSQWYDSWENGTFCTNCISHKIGFVWQYKDGKFINKIETMGINGGGANGEHYLRTDGSFVISRVERGYYDKCEEPDLYQLQRFVETFDDFEAAFYKYVDKIVGR